MNALTMKPSEACCLKLQPLQEGFAGTISLPLTDQATVAPVAANLYVYRAGVSTPAAVTGTIAVPVLPATTGVLTFTPTVMQQKYFSRYSRKLVIEAFLSDGTRVQFQDADTVLHPSLCFACQPCADGISDSASKEMAEHIDLCPDCDCTVGC
jgi:hypothetical protein